MTYAEVAKMRRVFAEFPRPGDECLVNASVGGWRGQYRATCIRVTQSGRLVLEVKTSDERSVRLLTDPDHIVHRYGPAEAIA